MRLFITRVPEGKKRFGSHVRISILWRRLIVPWMIAPGLSNAARDCANACAIRRIKAAGRDFNAERYDVPYVLHAHIGL